MAAIFGPLLGTPDRFAMRRALDQKCEATNFGHCRAGHEIVAAAVDAMPELLAGERLSL